MGSNHIRYVGRRTTLGSLTAAAVISPIVRVARFLRKSHRHVSWPDEGFDARLTFHRPAICASTTDIAGGWVRKALGAVVLLGCLWGSAVECGDVPAAAITLTRAPMSHTAASVAVALDVRVVCAFDPPSMSTVSAGAETARHTWDVTRLPLSGSMTKSTTMCQAS